MATAFENASSPPSVEYFDRAQELSPYERLSEQLHDLVRSWGVSCFSERMLLQWLQRELASESDNQDDAVARLRKWILEGLNGQLSSRPSWASPWQHGCPDLIPRLQATPVWENSYFSWVQTLEDAFPVIRQELLALKHEKGFQPYRAPSWASDIQANDGIGSAGHDAGDWHVFYLYLHNIDFSKNRSLCPKTVEVLDSIPNLYDHAFFSALAPSTHVKKHHGPTNKKLRCHLPLVVPEGSCRLRVGSETVHVQEGKCFLFDDSFEHEAWNDDPNHARIVLILDVWHPDFSPREKKFFSFLRNAQLRMDKKQAEGDEDNFFSIIQEASRADMTSPDAIWS